MKKIILSFALIVLVSLPFFVFAQAGDITPLAPKAIQQIPVNNVTPDVIPRDATSAVNATSLFCDMGPRPSLGNLFDYASCLISRSVIPLMFAIAMAMFIWGVVQYVINSDEESKKAKGRDFMIWGIIALAVMVSVWGLVSILGKTFGISSVIPQVSTQR